MNVCEPRSTGNLYDDCDRRSVINEMAQLLAIILGVMQVIQRLIPGYVESSRSAIPKITPIAETLDLEVSTPVVALGAY